LGQPPESNSSEQGFSGLIDNFFVYSAELTVQDLQLIRLSNYNNKHYSPVAGNAGNAGYFNQVTALLLTSLPAQQSQQLQLIDGTLSFSPFEVAGTDLIYSQTLVNGVVELLGHSDALVSLSSLQIQNLEFSRQGGAGKGHNDT
jgi:hypothetical protein